jgi:hypothetical protein
VRATAGGGSPGRSIAGDDFVRATAGGGSPTGTSIAGDDFVRAAGASIGADFVRATAGDSTGTDFVRATAGASMGVDFVRATAGDSTGADFVRATTGGGSAGVGGAGGKRSTSPVPPEKTGGVTTGGVGVRPPSGHDAARPSVLDAVELDAADDAAEADDAADGVADAAACADEGDDEADDAAGADDAAACDEGDDDADDAVGADDADAGTAVRMPATGVRMAIELAISVGTPVEISVAISVGTADAEAGVVAVIVRGIDGVVAVIVRGMEGPEPRGGVPPFDEVAAPRAAVGSTSVSGGRAAAIAGGVRRGAGCVGARPTVEAPPTGCVGARPTMGPPSGWTAAMAGGVLRGTGSVDTRLTGGTCAVGTRPTAGTVTCPVGTRPTTGGVTCPVGTRPTVGYSVETTAGMTWPVGTRPTAGGGLTRGAVTSRIGGIWTVGTPEESSGLTGSMAPVTRRPSARALRAAWRRAKTSTLSGVRRRMPRRMPGRLYGFAAVDHASTIVHRPRRTGVLSASWIENAVSRPIGRVVCVATKNDDSSQNA